MRIVHIYQKHFIQAIFHFRLILCGVTLFSIQK